MPKQRRAAASRSAARPAPRKSSRGSKPAQSSSRALTFAGRTRASKPTPRSKSSAVSTSSKPAGRDRTVVPKIVVPVAPAAPPPPRRPAFYEALTVYESGVRALQRHDFTSAADSFRAVIQGYPGERELVERARLYLQVCVRETARRPSGPETPSESVYAATVALNAGDVEAALGHLGRALEKAPDSDHAHYIMAVALVDKGDLPLAMVHLRQAVALNPENRSVALQDPDLETLQGVEAFHQMLGTQSESTPRRVKARR
jgi:tetratricopeptide (TPR) repeat protein